MRESSFNIKNTNNLNFGLFHLCILSLDNAILDKFRSLGFNVISFSDVNSFIEYYRINYSRIDLTIVQSLTDEIKEELKKYKLAYPNVIEIGEDIIEVVVDSISRLNDSIINEDLGILLAGNSKKLFLNILKSFYLKYKDYEIDESNLAIEVHKIKGISLNIGSKLLFRYSFYIDRMIKESCNLEDFKLEYDIFKKILKEIIIYIGMIYV